MHIYICRYSGVRRFNNFGVPFGFPSLPAELEILATVDEIEVLSLRGAPDPRHCRRNRVSEASRNSRSSELWRKSRFRGLAELQVMENLDDIELRRLRGAPNRALNADTGARWGALASISEESRSSESSKILTKSRFGGFAELQVEQSTRTRERDEGLQLRKCRRNYNSEASRNSRPSKMVTKSRCGGFAELQVGHTTRTRERDGGLQPLIERSQF